MLSCLPLHRESESERDCQDMSERKRGGGVTDRVRDTESSLVSYLMETLSCFYVRYVIYKQEKC